MQRYQQRQLKTTAIPTISPTGKTIYLQYAHRVFFSRVLDAISNHRTKIKKNVKRKLQQPEKLLAKQQKKLNFGHL